ncbi:hypothetical protein ACFSTC_39495 [Nonomuraea ferruginea]
MSSRLLDPPAKPVATTPGRTPAVIRLLVLATFVVILNETIMINAIPPADGRAAHHRADRAVALDRLHADHGGGDPDHRLVPAARHHPRRLFDRDGPVPGSARRWPSSLRRSRCCWPPASSRRPARP